MKAILFFLTVLLIPAVADAEDDEQRVSINIVLPENNGIPAEANRYLATKMQQMVTLNGFADNGLNKRFVLTAKVNVVSKDVVPSFPARISQNLEITFLIGDIQENKLYETLVVNAIGVGENEAKAFIKAFSTLKVQDKDYSDFLSEAKNKIVEYYTANCKGILEKANAIADIGRYDEAIYMLMSVPNVCSDCYDRCLAAVPPLYQKKIDNEAQELMGRAKAVWTADQSYAGASQALKLLAQASPDAAIYPEIEAFIETIGTKIRDDEKREWEMEVKRYEDSCKLEQSIVKAYRDVGVAWGENQPRTKYSYIISLW